MSNWKDFEIESTRYLNQKYGTYASFTRKGGPDSTLPDILVQTRSGQRFYMEAKYSPAQCGQFVLLPNLSTCSFDYSPLNSSELNRYSQIIIDHMDVLFEEFKESGTKGKDIHIQNEMEIFSSWIINDALMKGIRYFITNHHTLLPVEHFLNYFDVSAKYRVKRSGSSSVGKKRISSVLRYIQDHNYPIQHHEVKQDKLFIHSNLDLHNKRFVLSGYEYMFSIRESIFEVRKLSNTFNANVIFSIQLKDSKVGLSDEEFISALKQK